MNDVLSDAEVADILGCEAKTVNEAASIGALPAVKYGRSWRFPRSALLQRLHEQALENSAKTAPQPSAVSVESQARPSRRSKVPPMPSSPA